MLTGLVGAVANSSRRNRGRTGGSSTGAGGGGGSFPRTLTSSQITFLQAQESAATSRWTNVKAIADAQVAKGATVNANDENYVVACALLYAVTGTQSYADRVETVLMDFCIADPLDDPGLPYFDYDRGYGYASDYLAPLRCLDWAYNGLSVSCRQRVAEWLMDFADYIWPETNTATSGPYDNVSYSPENPGSNYYARYLYTGLAAFVADDDQGTSVTTPGSTSPRTTYFQNFLKVTKWKNQIAPFFVKAQSASTGEGGLGGGFAEGEGYGTHTTWYYGRTFNALASAGVTLDATDTTPAAWANEALQYSMHCITPGFVYRQGFGDSGAAAVATGGSGSYFRASILNQMALATDSTLKAQALYTINTFGNIPTSDNGLGAVIDELLYYDPGATPASDLSGLPLYYDAAGPGHFMYRNSWTDSNATQFSFDGGAWSPHSAYNCGNLRIWKGASWLSGSANTYGASGIRKETWYYNNVILNESYQNATATNSPPYTYQTPTANLVVLRQDMKKAYNSPTTRFDDFIRTVVYLPTKDTFIVVDDMTATNSAHVKTQLWQMKDLPNTPGSTTFKLSNDEAAYHGYGEIVDVRGGTPTLSIQKIGLGSSSYGLLQFSALEVKNGGSGYAVNDTGTVNGGTGGTYVVDAVDGGGAVTAFTITAAGTGYGEPKWGSTYSTATGGAQPGSGTGFTMDGNSTSFAIRVDLDTGTARQIVVTTLQLTSGASAPYTVSATDNTTSYDVVVDDLTVTIPLNPATDVTVA